MDIPATRNGPGWVIMTHPTLPDSYSEVTEEALEKVWAPKGWVKAEQPVEPAPANADNGVTGDPPPPPPPAARTQRVGG